LNSKLKTQNSKLVTELLATIFKIESVNMNIDNQVILNILSKVLNLQADVLVGIQESDDLSDGLGSLRSIDLVVDGEIRNGIR
jgi:hypothetical protein